MSSGELALRLRDVLGNIDHEPTTRCTLRIGDHVSVEDDEGKGLSGTVESWAPNRQQTYVEVLVRVGG
jgi:transcription antitermination factor NusG